jgi:hypothetical protein
MEIILKHFDTTITVKKEYEDVSIDELFEMINTALIGISWQQSQIDDYIIQKAEELKEKQNEND